MSKGAVTVPGIVAARPAGHNRFGRRGAKASLSLDSEGVKGEGFGSGACANGGLAITSIIVNSGAKFPKRPDVLVSSQNSYRRGSSLVGA